MKQKSAWVLGVAIVLAGLGAVAAEEAVVLNGTAWTVKVSPDPLAKQQGQQEFRETLSFVEGKLITVEGGKLGFESAGYTMKRSGEKDWSFNAEQKSPARGTYVWSGTAHGDDIRGKLVWTTGDHKVLTYSFTGDKKR